MLDLLLALSHLHIPSSIKLRNNNPQLFIEHAG